MLCHLQLEPLPWGYLGSAVRRAQHVRGKVAWLGVEAPGECGMISWRQAEPGRPAGAGGQQELWQWPD